MSEYKLNKYIIKNCPCYCEGTAIKGNEQITQGCDSLQRVIKEGKVRLEKCYNIDDCLLKRLVERCRSFGCDCLIEGRKCGAMDNMSMCCDLWKSKHILDLLEIEEVNEEQESEEE